VTVPEIEPPEDPPLTFLGSTLVPWLLLTVLSLKHLLIQVILRVKSELAIGPAWRVPLPTVVADRSKTNAPPLVSTNGIKSNGPDSLISNGIAGIPNLVNRGDVMSRCILESVAPVSKLKSQKLSAPNDLSKVYEIKPVDTGPLPMSTVIGDNVPEYEKYLKSSVPVAGSIVSARVIPRESTKNITNRKMRFIKPPSDWIPFRNPVQSVYVFNQTRVIWKDELMPWPTTFIFNKPIA
jgi:hypothetical protein